MNHKHNQTMCSKEQNTHVRTQNSRCLELNMLGHKSFKAEALMNTNVRWEYLVTMLTIGLLKGEKSRLSL